MRVILPLIYFSNYFNVIEYIVEYFHVVVEANSYICDPHDLATILAELR